MTGDNRLQPVGHRWTTSCTPCGSFLRPQSVESVRPRIHRGLTWPDGLSTAHPVDTIGTTSRSPGCGRQKVTKSVESGRNQARIRTTDVVPVAVKRGTTASGQVPEALGALLERVPGVLRGLLGRPPKPGTDVTRAREPRAGTARAAGRNRESRGSEQRKAPSGRCPGAPLAAYRLACQPFLMRLVSSVTWL
jgi:hypothetical protein